MSTAKAASRAMAMFELFGLEGRPLLLTEIAPGIGVPMSTCHGLVRTLLDRGYLYALNRRRGFYPTRKLHIVAGTIAAKDTLLRRIVPFLELLRDEVRETVIIGTRQDDKVLYLEVLEGVETIRYSARPGDFKPLHSSSIGKALLSAGGESLWRHVSARPLEAITARTVTDAARLLEDLKQSRERGYFVTRGENVADVTAVARTVEAEGLTLGIAIAGPSYRMDGAIAGHAEKLVRTCADIEARLR